MQCRGDEKVATTLAQKAQHMYFESGGIYHIYNQGNNRQQIFFERQNYLFFVRKIKDYVTPYGNILAWCLMPNHFHLMLEVISVEVTPVSVNSVGVTLIHPDTMILPSHPIFVSYL